MRKLITALLLLATYTGYSQINDLSVRGVLLQKFSENIKWPKQYIGDTFVIGIAGKDTAFYHSLSQLSSKALLHKKPIRVVRVTAISQSQSCNVVYIPPEENYRAEKYWEAIDGAHTLLITENVDNMLYSMINIEYSNTTNTFSFVINRSNLLLAQLEPMPSLLLVGGTEIDVRDMYRDTKKQLDAEMAKVNEQKKLILEQLSRISNLDNQLARQSQKLDRQLETIHQHRELIDNQRLTLNNLTDNILAKNDSIKRNKDFIASQQATIALQKQAVGMKENELDRLNDHLQNVSEKIHEKQLQLQRKEVQLEVQEAVISKQKLYLWSIAGGLCFVLLILWFIYYAYRSKTIANKALDEKNLMLEQHQLEIHEQSKQLMRMNSVLNEQKTELEDALGQLKTTQAQLVHSEKMASLGTLTAGIAHEINNPINFITSGIEGLKTISDPLTEMIEDYTELIQKLPEADEQKMKFDKLDADEIVEGLNLMISNIQTGAERATEIVRGLNDFSRSRDAELNSVDIRDNIESTLLILNSEIKHKVTVKKFYEQLPEIRCYAGKINQVLLNILNNAVQAVSEGGCINISTEMHGKDSIRIRIADNGKGIAPSDLQHIFEPFFTTKKVGDGTGLGLAISYSIIEQHNGAIDVKSKEGQGTEFIIRLPIEGPVGKEI